MNLGVTFNPLQRTSVEVEKDKISQVGWGQTHRL